MKNDNFESIVRAQLEHCRRLLCKKGEEYDTDLSDRFRSFKIAAKLQNKTPLQTLGGMMAKHTVSIYDMIDQNNSDLAIWEEKITDHINYLLLLKGLLMDEYGGQNE